MASSLSLGVFALAELRDFYIFVGQALAHFNYPLRALRWHDVGYLVAVAFFWRGAGGRAPVFRPTVMDKTR